MRPASLAYLVFGGLLACSAFVDTTGLSGGGGNGDGGGGDDGGAALGEAGSSTADDAGTVACVTCDGARKCISSVCVPSDGLLGWWSFDEEGSQVLDVSGVGNHGRNERGKRVPGKIGMGIELSNDACVAIPASPSLRLAGGRAITMMAWSHASGCADNSAAHGIILNKEDSFELGVRCQRNDLALRAAIRTASNWDWAGTAPLTYRAWHHLAVTWDGDRVRHYVDGVERDGHTHNGSIQGTNSGLGLGCRSITASGGSENANECLIGILDEVAIYDRALSAEELRAYFEATR